jgi:hypothetical protein
MTLREMLDRLREIDRVSPDRLDVPALFVWLDMQTNTLRQLPVGNFDHADMSVPDAEYGQIILCDV